MRRIEAVSAVLLTAVGLAACQTAGSGGMPASSARPASSPTSSAPPVPGAPTGERLREILAGSSASGPAACSYFGADGTLVRRAGGQVATGSWTVDGRFICESVGGSSPACYTLDFLPLGGATMTPADGSPAPAQSVQIASGNSCG